MTANIPVKVHFGEDYSAVEMLYGRQNFSMVIMVPNGNLKDFLTDLDGETWADLTAALDDIPLPQKKDVFIPKFKFEYDKKLNDQLQHLGMTDAFIPGIANLSRIADAGLFVSFVKQNSFVEVNEEGTEAAAVTTIGIEFTAIEQFAVNKPFIFAIRERSSNTLLFIGKVINPIL
jgi:serpin B